MTRPHTTVWGDGLAADRSLRIVWTPTVAGPLNLEVRSKDAAGNFSPPTAYAFTVAAGSLPVASWRLDDGQGTTAAGVPGGCISTCPPATLASGAAWTTAGRVDGGRPGPRRRGGRRAAAQFDEDDLDPLLWEALEETLGDLTQRALEEARLAVPLGYVPLAR